MHDLTTGPGVGNTVTITDLLQRIADDPESGLFCAGKTYIAACNRPDVVSQSDLRALALRMRLDGTTVVNTMHIVSCLSSKEKTTAWVQQALASLPVLNGLLFCLSMAHDGVEDITLPDQAQPTVLLRPLYLGKVDRRGNRLADYVLTDLHQRPDARVLTLLLIDPDDTAVFNGLSMTGIYITRLMQDAIGRVQLITANRMCLHYQDLVAVNAEKAQQLAALRVRAEAREPEATRVESEASLLKEQIDRARAQVQQQEKYLADRKADIWSKARQEAAKKARKLDIELKTLRRELREEQQRGEDSARRVDYCEQAMQELNLSIAETDRQVDEELKLIAQAQRHIEALNAEIVSRPFTEKVIGDGTSSQMPKTMIRARYMVRSLGAGEAPTGVGCL